MILSRFVNKKKVLGHPKLHVRSTKLQLVGIKIRPFSRIWSREIDLGLIDDLDEFKSKLGLNPCTFVIRMCIYKGKYGK
ncbi:hypothetical protein L2E82_52359 [Cichorium intybus]|nr:hypothetical protein L2E82_52359 [Cichorium intybus]